MEPVETDPIETTARVGSLLLQPASPVEGRFAGPHALEARRGLTAPISVAPQPRAYHCLLEASIAGRGTVPGT